MAALLSLCCRKTASSLNASRWARGAPPTRSSTSSSSGHAQPSWPETAISSPSSFRWMLAISNFVRSTFRSVLQNQGSIGQLRQVTCTEYIRSAPKPRAHRSRLAATSA